MKSWITRTLVLAMLMVCIAGVAQAQSADTTHPAGNAPVAAKESALAGQPAEAQTEANLILPDLNSVSFLGVTGHDGDELGILFGIRECRQHCDLRDVARADDGVADLAVFLGHPVPPGSLCARRIPLG